MNSNIHQIRRALFIIASVVNAAVFSCKGSDYEIMAGKTVAVIGGGLALTVAAQRAYNKSTDELAFHNILKFPFRLGKELLYETPKAICMFSYEYCIKPLITTSDALDNADLLPKNSKDALDNADLLPKNSKSDPKIRIERWPALLASIPAVLLIGGATLEVFLKYYQVLLVASLMTGEVLWDLNRTR